MPRDASLPANMMVAPSASSRASINASISTAWPPTFIAKSSDVPLSRVRGAPLSSTFGRPPALRMTAPNARSSPRRLAMASSTVAGLLLSKTTAPNRALSSCVAAAGRSIAFSALASLRAEIHTRSHRPVFASCRADSKPSPTFAPVIKMWLLMADSRLVPTDGPVRAPSL